MIFRVVIEPGEDGYFVRPLPVRSCCHAGQDTRGSPERTSGRRSSFDLEPEPEAIEVGVGREVVDLTL